MSATLSPRVLAFDVFGTVVDWRTSVIGELTRFGEAHGAQHDWVTLTDDWRGGYPAADLDQLTRAWHRLDPWPDSVGGLARLKARFTITTLSNGNVSLLTNMAKHAGLPWDCVISAGLMTAYVVRPLERGEGRRLPRFEPGEFDYTADDFFDLASQLGA